MSKQQSPVLRLLIGGFAMGALGHAQGPVAMAADLLAGGPGATTEPTQPSVQQMAALAPEIAGPQEMADSPAVGNARDETALVATPAGAASIDLGSEQSIDHLRMLVTAMEPQQAAAILEAIPLEDAARVLTGLPVSSAVAMLTVMSAEGSAELTEELAKAPS